MTNYKLLATLRYDLEYISLLTCPLRLAKSLKYRAFFTDLKEVKTCDFKPKTPRKVREGSDPSRTSGQGAKKN